MMVVVAYDICTENSRGVKRLNKIRNICKDYGIRIQNSLVECVVDPGEWAELKFKLEKIINNKTDSLRYYFLGANWERRVSGAGVFKFDMSKELIF